MPALACPERSRGWSGHPWRPPVLTRGEPFSHSWTTTATRTNLPPKEQGRRRLSADEKVIPGSLLSNPCRDSRDAAACSSGTKSSHCHEVWRGSAHGSLQGRAPRISSGQAGALSVTGKRAVYGLHALQSYGKWERCTVTGSRRMVDTADYTVKRTSNW